MSHTVLPGEMIGVLGGGQLGRMFAQAAQSMGYRVCVLDPDPESPTGQIAHQHIQADYTDHAALDQMSACCRAITTEFENVPAESLRYLAGKTRVAPSASAVEIAQDRIVEKTYFAQAGLQTPAWVAVESSEQAAAAWRKLGLKAGESAILKTARLGYDGKGQQRCHSAAEVIDAFEHFGQVVCVLEHCVELDKEVSVVLARGDDGEIRCFPVAENHHENGILATTTVPTSLDEVRSQQALMMAKQLAAALDYVGVMALELFVTRQGDLLANEMAPRPHNSGHYTLDATACSQFEQQVRALCGLPLAETTLLSPVVMENLLGDRWQPDTPNWPSVLAVAGAKLHLYGKAEARAGRKMGHINWLKL